MGPAGEFLVSVTAVNQHHRRILSVAERHCNQERENVMSTKTVSMFCESVKTE
jgi:hypothetical protein